jgi:hypothetical protein
MEVKRMYKTFEDAKNAALDVIAKNYGGRKMGCVVTEHLPVNGERSFNFHFYDVSHGYIKNLDGSIDRQTLI